MYIRGIHPWPRVDVWVPLIQSWEKDELSGWVRSARPQEGSAEGGFVIGFLSEGGSAAVVCSGRAVSVSRKLKVDPERLNLTAAIFKIASFSAKQMLASKIKQLEKKILCVC